MKTKLGYLALAVLAGSLPSQVAASTIQADQNAGGIGYAKQVTMGGLDTAVISAHVGAWSWEDNSLFNASNGEDPVGWTHQSNWYAVNLTVTSVFKVRIERDAAVPWPNGTTDPNRLASTASMYPSFTLWKNWDNDVAPHPQFQDSSGNPVQNSHTYNNDGDVAWAEDLIHTPNYNGVLAHYNNSTLEVIERTYILPAGQYTFVIGSNAPATDTNRQGYKATFTTTQELPIVITGDSYFVESATKPVSVPIAEGFLKNDTGIEAADTLEIVTQPTKGTVVTKRDGSFTYTPGAYFGVAGYDTFTYRFLVDGDPNTPTTIGTVSVSTFAAAAGVHAGHIKDEDTSEIAGLVKLDVTRAGRWSAAVSYLGKKYGLSGVVGLHGDLTGRGGPELDIEFHLATHADGDRHVHVHIHGTGAHFAAHVKKSPFSKDNPPPSLGRHDVTLAVTSSSAGAPQAAGSGRLMVSANGTATLVGQLGDKAVFSSGTAVVRGPGAGPAVPIYSGVYRKGVGSISGDLAFGSAAESPATGTLVLTKPVQTTPASPGHTITYDVTTTIP